MLTYAIADIHGMFEMMKEIMSAISNDADGEPYRLVMLGDYVDRGPDSRKTLALLRTPPEDPACRERILLRGNHDDMMIEAVLGKGDEYWARSGWESNGGEITLGEYAGGYSDPALLADARFLLDETRYWFRDESGRTYVHAGMRPGGPAEVQKEQDFLWIRNEFLESRFDFGGLVVHGHTITRNRRPDERPNRLGLDTGAFLQDGFCTAARFDGAVPGHASLYLRTAHSRYGTAPVERIVPDRTSASAKPAA